MNEAPKPPCKHPHQYYTDGGLYLRCRTCPRRYVAVFPDFDIPDIMARAEGLGDLDHRSDPLAAPFIPTPPKHPKSDK